MRISHSTAGCISTTYYEPYVNTKELLGSMRSVRSMWSMRSMRWRGFLRSRDPGLAIPGWDAGVGLQGLETQHISIKKYIRISRCMRKYNTHTYIYNKRILCLQQKETNRKMQLWTYRGWWRRRWRGWRRGWWRRRWRGGWRCGLHEIKNNNNSYIKWEAKTLKATGAHEPTKQVFTHRDDWRPTCSKSASSTQTIRRKPHKHGASRWSEEHFPKLLTWVCATQSRPNVAYLVAIYVLTLIHKYQVVASFRVNIGEK